MYQKIKIIVALLLSPMLMQAQIFYNNGAVIYASTGSMIYINGSLTNNNGSDFQNNGNLELKGDLSNNQVMSNAGNGTLKLTGTSTQNISGTSPFLANHISFNNVGTTLNNSLKIFGESQFTNGIILSSDPNNPLCYANTGTISISNAPSNVSHVNGYVLKEGTGSFDYPVGDGIQYQKVGVNLSTNANGMRVKYIGADAGSGNFSTSGTSSIPLINYNNLEYWEVLPQTTASGNVTMYWDSYNNTPSPLFGLNRVAHKVGSSWLNEGTFATGNVSSGYVVSNPITSWDKFTLGRINQIGLPFLVTLNLSVYLEGYYAGNNLMEPVLLNQGQSVDPMITDSITIELRPALTPNTVAAQTKTILHTNGNAACQFLITGGNYYIVIKHRNSIQTWSATPIAFTGSSVAYDFSYAANQAYGNNQKEVEPGIFALYSGEINDDENVDLLDLSLLENDINNFQFGYFATDINGDGNVDLLDSPIVESNINDFIFSNHP